MFRRYCPPTSYSTPVICPSVHTLHASMRAVKVLPPASATRLSSLSAASARPRLRALNASFDAMYEVIVKRLDELAIPTTLGALDVPRDAASRLAAKAIQDSAAGTNPREATLAEREAGLTFEVLARQLKSLRAVKPSLAERVSLAYEPVWAIGTGHTATPQQAQEAHAECRRLTAEYLDQEIADNMRILYGGSVKPANAAELLAQPDVDGALVGGASLTIEQFGPILDAASAAS